MSASFYDLLKYAKTGIASPSMTAYDKLKALSMCKAGFPVKTLTGVPPITFQSDGTPLTAWSISGNMVQVSPNLLDESKSSDADATHINYMKSTPVLLKSGQAYTFSCNTACNGLYIRKASDDSNLATGNSTASITYTPSSEVLVYFRVWNSGGVAGLQLMFNVGSTELPYIPYGATPTPDAPITPEECGDRTAQIIDYTKSEAGGIDASGNLVDGQKLWRSTVFYKIAPDTQYAYSKTTNTLRIYYYDFSKTYMSRQEFTGAYNAGTLTIPEGTQFIKWTILTTSERASLENVAEMKIMLNPGSTALPYEPYGYKIPLTCAGQTVPVYLGQVSTVRRVKKLVLTGTENWGNYGGGNHFALTFAQTAAGANQFVPICSHFKAIQAASWNDLQDGEMSINPTDRNSLRIYDSRYQSDTTAFKAWLASQYAAGTPVTVWYVLAAPETGIVNEPLCKIGNYADELSSTDAGVSIPTAKGQNTLTVDTTLPPSEVSITGHIKSN